MAQPAESLVDVSATGLHQLWQREGKREGDEPEEGCAGFADGQRCLRSQCVRGVEWELK